MLLPDDKATMPLPTRRWLSPDESAAYLGISRSQFNAVASSGRVQPSRSVGDRLPRYDVADLDTMMQEGKHGVGSDTQR